MGKITIDLKKLWTISLVLYIICSSAFSYGELKMLNTYALYFFLGVSALNILLRRRVRLNAAAISIIFYTILSLFSLIYTPTAQSKAMSVMYNYITMAVIVLCVVQYIDDMKDIRIIMTSFMLAGLALALHVYAQYGNQFWDMLKEIAESDSEYASRVGNELTNENTIGMYTMISALIAAFYVFTDRSSKVKTVVYIAIAVFCFIISTSAASRKSIVLLIVSIICFWLYSSVGTRDFLRQIRNILILVAGVATLLYLINILPLFKSLSMRLDLMFRFLSGGEGTTSEQARMHYITEGLSVWEDNIFFGEGFATSIFHFGTYSHNNYIEILMSTGLVGFTLFYIPYVIAVYKYLKDALAYRTLDSLSTLLFALLMSIIVCSFALVYYYDRYYMILVATIYTAVKCLSKEKYQKSSLQNRGEQL